MSMDWTVFFSLQAKVNDAFDGVEEGYESSRDEISSVSSYNHLKEDMHKAFGSSLSLRSIAARSSNRGSVYLEDCTSISSNFALPQLSVAEVLHDSTGGKLFFNVKASISNIKTQTILYVRVIAWLVKLHHILQFCLCEQMLCPRTGLQLSHLQISS